MPHSNQSNHRAQQEQTVGSQGGLFNPHSHSHSPSPSPSPLISPFSQSLLPPATAASKTTPAAAAGYPIVNISPHTKSASPSVASPRPKRVGGPTPRLEAKSAAPTSGGKVSLGIRTSPTPSTSGAYRPTFLPSHPGSKAADYRGQKCCEGLGGIRRATTCFDDHNHPPAHADKVINDAAHPSCGPTRAVPDGG